MKGCDSLKADENLIREVQLAATGATIHDVNATITVYREFCKYPPKEKLLYDWSQKRPGRYLTEMPKHETWTTNEAFVLELEARLRGFLADKCTKGWF
jgi:hypothetical protein